ncbi:MAG: putative Histidine kinase protein [Chthoniobacteraceae bacterium]|nr:putative Histidine kinase protein [Chthoniobacteraceae bacterium]
MSRETGPTASPLWEQLRSLTWPALEPEEAETVRRNKLGVRGLNGVLIGMVSLLLLVLARELVSRELWMQLAFVSLGGLTYLLWALLGITPVSELVLRPCSATRWPARAWPGTLLFFAVEFLIATWIILAALPMNPAGVLRIVLLPILAHAVIFLPWAGIAMTASLCATLYLFILSDPPAGGGPAGFLIEGAFTIVCMHMVVSSQKSRAEIERMAADLAAANRHLGAYAAQAEELAAARERNRLAREIHDSLGHYLTVVRVQLEAALAVYDRAPELAMDAVRKAQALVGEGLREIRNSIAVLRAAPLESRTLCEALLALVAENEAAGLRVKIEVHGMERELSAAGGLTLYRVAQEGLTNVRKHAAGAGARLLINFDPAQNVSLTISDEGPGAGPVTGGFGLLGLRERAALLGGKFSTQTTPGKGFRLAIELPE